MLFVVYESTKANDPVTYPDYSYVCDVYVDSTLVERMIARPDPTRKMGVFDVSRALQPYASYQFSAASNKVDYDARLSYQLKFGEQYGGTLYTNLTVDSTRYAFKTYKPRPLLNSEVIANGKASNMPSTVNWHRSDYLLMSYFSNSSGIADFTADYLNGGSLVDSEVFTNADFTANKIRQINFGDLAYNASGVDTIKVYGGATSETLLLTVNLLCAKHPVFTLVWLNPFGGYDSQTFGMVSKKMIEVNRKAYSPLHYQIDPSGVIQYGANNVFYGGKKGYGSIVNVKLSLTSHLLNDAEYKWLADLFISPEVYIYAENTDLGANGYFIPVTISANNYDYRTYKNSRLTPLQFDVEFSDTYNSQWL